MPLRFTPPARCALRSSNDCWRSRQVTKSAGDTTTFGRLLARSKDQSTTTRSISRTGSSAPNADEIVVYAAVVAPMPRPSVRTATAAKPGFRARPRAPYLMSWRKVSTAASVGAQRDDRVDTRGATRGHVRRRGGDEGQQREHGGVGRRVVRRDAEEQRAQRLQHEQCARQADGGANSDQTQAADDNRGRQPPEVRTQRNADTELLRPLGDVER